MRVTSVLKTNRLTIRELELIDIDNVHQLHSLPESDEFNTLGIPETIQVTETILSEWLQEKNKTERTTYVFAIQLIEGENFIGLIAINLKKKKYQSGEVWYKIHKDFWAQGYATEALFALLDFGFNHLQLHRIEAGCAVENIASIRVIEKVGMTREGIQRQNLPIRGEWKDNYCYGILKEEFIEK